jgi:hypothetical protein
MRKKPHPLLLMILLSSLILSSLPTIGQSDERRSGHPSVPSLGAAVGKTERIHNEARIEGPNLIVAENSVRRLEFTSQGLHYVPKKRSERMADLGLRIELKAINSGRKFYQRGADERRSRPENEGNEVTYSRPMGVTELYQALDSGVEQFFILAQNLSPTGEDLWITSEVKTELRPESPRVRTSRGVVFYAGDDPIVRIGAVIAIDATGRELRAELELDGNQLSIVVNGAWLRQAAYPVVVDPFIGPLASIATAGPHRWSPAMADDPDQNRYLVAWEQPVGDDFEIMGQLIDADGKPSACRPEPFSISLNPAGRDFSPEVGYDSASRRFLVVWEEQGPAAGSTALDYSIKGRLVGGPSGCAQVSPSGPAIQISDAGGMVERSADVALGVASDASSRFLVVYLRANAGAKEADVYGQMLNQDGSRCSGPVLIGGPSGIETRFHPSVAYGEPGVAEFFSVVYRSSNRALRMARFAPTCGGAPQNQVIIDPVVTDDPSTTEPAATDVQPTIVYSPVGRQWLINWIDYSPRVGAVLRWAQLPPASLLWQNTFTTLLGAFPFIRGLSVTGSTQSPDLVVALAVGASSTGGFDIFLFHLQYSFDYFSANFRRDSLTGGGVNDWYPVVRSSPGRDDYFVVWQRELANGSSDIVGQSYVP